MSASAAESGAALGCANLSVSVGGATLLANADLAVPGGSLTTVLGPSGAGKTTLLRAIAGLMPASGSVQVAGRELGGTRSHQRPIGLVFQEPRLFPGMDVADNVAFALRVAGSPRRRRRARAEALLDEVDLAGYAPRSVADLSGGEQQRVALARALAADPAVLLLDEPLSAVDAQRRADLRALIRRTRRARGLTMLYVTHDRSEAAALGDAVAVMLRGRLVQTGPPIEVFERPADAEVAGLVGATNLLDGHVADGELVLERHRMPLDGGDGDALVTVRPEHVRLDPSSSWRLRVADVVYVGTHNQVRLVGHGLSLDAHVGLDHVPAPGDEVGVAVPPEHLWRIPGLPAGRTAGADHA